MVALSKFPKPTSELIKQLHRQGLCGSDDLIKHYLEWVGYSQLQRYWSIFQEKESFPSPSYFTPKNEIDFRNVVEIYNFDRELRALFGEAISQIEISLKALIVNHVKNSLTKPDDYLRAEIMCPEDQDNFERICKGYEGCKGNKNKKRCADCRSPLAQACPGYRGKQGLKKKIQQKWEYSRESWVEELKKCRGEVAERGKFPPFCHSVGTWHFDYAVDYFGAISKKFRKPISQKYGVYPETLDNWFRVLVEIRNKCAHNARLWNENIEKVIAIPKKDAIDLREALQGDKTRRECIFGATVVAVYLTKRMNLEIDAQRPWYVRMRSLWEKFPTAYNATLDKAGFPRNWASLKIWQ